MEGAIRALVVGCVVGLVGSATFGEACGQMLVGFALSTVAIFIERGSR